MTKLIRELKNILPLSTSFLDFCHEYVLILFLSFLFGPEADIFHVEVEEMIMLMMLHFHIIPAGST